MDDQITDLKNRISKTRDPNQKVRLLNILAQELRYTDLPSAIATSEQALGLARSQVDEKSPYKEGWAESLYSLGLFNVQAGNYNQALSYLFKALLLCEVLGDKRQSALVLSALGASYSHLSDYPNALDHFYKMFEIARELGDRAMEAQALNDIASLHMQLEEWSKGLMYLRDSLVLFEEFGDNKGQAEALNNSCVCYRYLGDHDKALTCGLKSVRLYREVNDQQGETRALYSIGEVYKVRLDYPQALTYFQRSLQLSEQMGLRLEIVRALQSMGDLYLQMGNTEQALSSLNRGLLIAHEINSRREQYSCHRSLSEVYRQMGEYQKALENSEQYYTIKEAVFNEEANRRLQNLEAVHQMETAKKESEIYQLKNVALQQEIRERQVVEEALRIANQQLQQAIREGEQLIIDLNAFDYMVAHDLKTPLANLVLSSEMVWDRLSKNLDPDSAAFLQIIRQMANKMNLIINELLILASVRQEEVKPQRLDMANIISDVERRLTYMIAEYEVEIIKPSVWPVVLGHAPWVEEVWANYISNAIKYGGHPPRVELGATPLPNGSVRFWVHDNGNGLSPEARAQLFIAYTRLDKLRATGHGLGLSIVKRIVEKLGGTVGLESEGEPGKGSMFSFTLLAG